MSLTDRLTERERECVTPIELESTNRLQSKDKGPTFELLEL